MEDQFPAINSCIIAHFPLTCKDYLFNHKYSWHTSSFMRSSGIDWVIYNFSEEQKEKVDRVKKIREELKLPVAIMLDMKGPEIRMGKFSEKVYS